MLGAFNAYSMLKEITFKVRIEQNQESIWEWGTGFFISKDGLALTAFHNLPHGIISQNRNTLDIFYHDEKLTAQCLLEVSLPPLEGDIAILKLDAGASLGFTPVPLGYLDHSLSFRQRCQYLAGRPVYAYGFPFGFLGQADRLVTGMIDSQQPLVTEDIKTHHGFSSGIEGSTEWLRIVGQRIQDLEGISGAPVLDSETGTIIAVVNGYFPDEKMVYGTELCLLLIKHPSLFENKLVDLKKLPRSDDKEITANVLHQLNEAVTNYNNYRKVLDDYRRFLQNIDRKIEALTDSLMSIDFMKPFIDELNRMCQKHKAQMKPIETVDIKALYQKIYRDFYKEKLTKTPKSVTEQIIDSAFCKPEIKDVLYNEDAHLRRMLFKAFFPDVAFSFRESEQAQKERWEKLNEVFKIIKPLIDEGNILAVFLAAKDHDLDIEALFANDSHLKFLQEIAGKLSDMEIWQQEVDKIQDHYRNQTIPIGNTKLSIDHLKTYVESTKGEEENETYRFRLVIDECSALTKEARQYLESLLDDSTTHKFWKIPEGKDDVRNKTP